VRQQRESPLDLCAASRMLLDSATVVDSESVKIEGISKLLDDMGDPMR